MDWTSICERVAERTHSDRATLRARSLQPGIVFDDVHRALEETTEMRALFALGFSLQRVYETAEAVAVAARGSVVAPLDLRAIANAVAAGNAAVRRVREDGGERLRAVCAGFVALPEVAAKIDHAIGERGEVLERASPALGRLRRGIVAAQSEARERTTTIARSARYRPMLQDDVVTMREGRFVVPVKAEFAGEFKGIVHDSSASGQTYFVEPLETLEANNRLRALRVQEEHEVARILAELSTLVGRHAEQLEANAEIYARLDLVAAKAEVGAAMRAEPPQLLETPDLRIVEGRHPLLGERAVAQSLDLNDECRVLLISGPNMGGKTVTLKMAGLFVLMAYCGMHLPAQDGTAIGRFDCVFADIGDEQSIAENMSTFSAHLRRIGSIVRQAGSHSLVLLDEIGGGTEPAAGAALAVALLERLLALGARTLATTHAGELKLFAHRAPHVLNASMRFDPATYAPTYHLDVGAPGQSLAFALARTMQVEPALIERAEALLSTSERDYDKALGELSEIRAQAAADRDAAEQARSQLEATLAEAGRREADLETEKRRVVREAEKRLSDALRNFTRELEQRSGKRPRGKITPGQSAALAKTLGELHRDLGLETARRARRAPEDFHVGDRVIVGALEQEGTIVAEQDDEAVVQIGAMRTTVKKEDLAKTRAAPKPRPRTVTADASAEIAARAMPEIDVRGKRFIEAEPLVAQWLDEAELHGYSPLRVIHGKGTGLLGRGLQQYLRTHPGVRSVRYGDENEGGSGVTIVELR
ncbi:MAG: endonuclease MutS2 [Candidatus Eremiobacteraeota bacterium]|nr:endonuclease MutS2 [Candidatus Eremiobacteraeota bacterium]